MSETARLKALDEYRILDTGNEASFDNLVKLAAYLCKTEFAQINFIDSERQWTKASHNIDIQVIPRGYGFCNHTLMNDYSMIIPDLTRDERFAEKEYVQGDPHLRFYAGVNIKSEDGYNIGTICVLGTKPKELSEDQIKGLKTLAREVEAQLELRRKKKQVDRKNIFLENSADLLIQVDPSDLYIVDINEVVDQYFSDPDEIIGKKLNAFFNEEDVEKLSGWLGSKSGEPYSDIMSLTGSDRKIFFRVDASHRKGRMFLTARDVTPRQEAHNRLKQNLKYQEAISEIALNINNKDSLDAKVNKSLERLCRVADVSRAYIFLDTEEGNKKRNKYEWCNEGVLPQFDKIEDVSYHEDFPGLKELLNKEGEIITSDVSNLDDTVGEYLQRRGVKSLIAFPIYQDDTFVGFVGFDESRRHREWTESEINLIKTASGIISNAYREEVLHQKVKNREKRLRRFIKQAPVAIAMLDTDMNYLERSSTWVEEFNSSEKSFLKEAERYDKPERWLKAVRKAMKGEEYTSGVSEFKAEDGTEAWYIVKILPWYNEEEEVRGSIIFIENITKEKESQAALEKTLKQKEVLLSEINHRVKNNLAVISAFLELEKYAMSDDVTKTILGKNIGRIKVLAIIYELLYQHHDFSHVNIEKLFDNLCEKFENDFHRIHGFRIKCQTDDIELTINKAIPLALLLYELISNLSENVSDTSGDTQLEISVKEEGKDITVRICNDLELTNKEDVLNSINPQEITIVEVLARQLDTELSYLEEKSCWKLSFTKERSKGSGSSLTKEEEEELSKDDT